MGIFGDNKPKVTKDEFKKVRQELYSRGVKSDKLNRVDQVLHGHLDESGIDKGIDAEELEKSIEHMREHKKDVRLSDSDIDKVEESLKKRL